MSWHSISSHTLTIILWFQSFWIFSLCLSQPWDILNMKFFTNSHTSTLFRHRYSIPFITQTAMFFLELLQVLEKRLQLNQPSLEFLTSIPHQRFVKQVYQNHFVMSIFLVIKTSRRGLWGTEFCFFHFICTWIQNGSALCTLCFYFNYFNQLTARVKSTKMTCRHAGFPFLPYLTAFPALISFYQQ